MSVSLGFAIKNTKFLDAICENNYRESKHIDISKLPRFFFIEIYKYLTFEEKITFARINKWYSKNIITMLKNEYSNKLFKIFSNAKLPQNLLDINPFGFSFENWTKFDVKLNFSFTYASSFRTSESNFTCIVKPKETYIKCAPLRVKRDNEGCPIGNFMMVKINSILILTEHESTKIEIPDDKRIDVLHKRVVIIASNKIKKILVN